jgi:hypothetical protein
MTLRHIRRTAATVAALGALGAVSLGTPAQAATRVMVKVQEAGVRNGPSYDGTIIIKRKHYGDCVTATSGNVAGSGYYWFQVSLAEGGYGWMRSDLVANPGNC